MEHNGETLEEPKNPETNLPYDMGFFKFVESRIDEIAELTKNIEAPKGNGLVFQRLPRHMRRRVMGHSTKRMPRSVREAHCKQLEKSGHPLPSKRPSRRYRRRPQNLLSEYNRRQKTYIWLETHIWHAKRFHMTERWGYKIPLHPNDKSVRACYRATTNHCLLHDISYFVCIELCGPESSILKGISRMCSTSCGPTFASESLLGGHHEGSVTLYAPDRYPVGAIGNVTFTWNPDKIDQSRQLWLWSHPSNYEELLEALQSMFELVEQEVETHQPEQPTKEEQKLLARPAARKFTSRDQKISLVLLKDALVRFRLTGELSHAVAQAVFQPVMTAPPPKTVSMAPMDIDDIFSAIEVPASTSSPAPSTLDDGWCSKYYSNPGRKNERQAQSDAWGGVLSGVTSVCTVPHRCVLGLTVTDPREGMPCTRTKAKPATSTSDPKVVESLDSILSCSPLWDANIRAAASSSKLSDHIINSRRATQLFSGPLQKTTSVPVILIQRPGLNRPEHKVQGFGGGWDIMAPVGWAMPLWRALIMQGARVGGLREFNAHTTETFHLREPLMDTLAGHREQQRETSEARDAHFRRPPDKRLNFVKLGMPCPFGVSWLQLLQEWSPSTPLTDFFILRDLQRLQVLQQSLISNNPPPGPMDPRSLVPVRVVLSEGGSLEPWSPIYIPQGELDLTGPPLEPAHSDPREEERKRLRNEHQAKLRHLRRRRVKDRQKGLNEDAERGQKEAEKIAFEHEHAMRELWLPERPKSIRMGGFREVAGFVVQGGYCYSEGKAAGVGLIAETALAAWQHPGERVLVRSVSCLQYRIASFNILCS